VEQTESPALKKCLLVDDEPSICQTIAFALETEGWSVQACPDLSSGRKAAMDKPFDLALIDLRLGRRSGLDLLPVLRARHPGIPVVIITAYASIPSAVDAMRRGATDYLHKPFDPDELRRVVAQAVAARAHLRREGSASTKPAFESRVPAMQSLFWKIRKMAESDATTLLFRGETGTGKGVLAKAVHDLGGRSGASFMVVACPSLSQETLESRLFGRERGVFTGPHGGPGRLAQADGGTLFLDEVGDLPLALQAKLLRVLRERDYERADGAAPKAAVRIISATSADLPAAVRAGRFRQDLYYRLSALELRVPPLRERIDDLPELIASILGELRREMGRGPKSLSPQAMARLRTYPWPGNIRELRNLLERVCVLADQDEVQLEDLAGLYEPVPREEAGSADFGAAASMDQVEAAHIRKVLSQTQTLEQAAKVLGLTGVTLWRKRKKYGL
jgi:two-component system, NtrC family, response regulator AlgB